MSDPEREALKKLFAEHAKRHRCVAKENPILADRNNEVAILFDQFVSTVDAVDDNLFRRYCEKLENEEQTNRAVKLRDELLWRIGAHPSGLRTATDFCKQFAMEAERIRPC